MNIYAYISIHTYFNDKPFSREGYKLANKDGVYYWEYVTAYEFRSIELVYQINIAVSNEDRLLYYNRAPNIAFNERHLECPLVEKGKW